MRSIGVPYTQADINGSHADVTQQANDIVNDLDAAGVKADPNSEMVALIAFLQRIGTHPETKTPSKTNVSINR